MRTLNGTNSVRKLIRDNISSGANGSDAFTSIYFVIVSVLSLPESALHCFHGVKWTQRWGGAGE